MMERLGPFTDRLEQKRLGIKLGVNAEDVEKATCLSEGEAARVGMNDPYASLCSSCGISMLRGGLEDNNFEEAGAEMVRLCEDRCKDIFVLYGRVRVIYKEGHTAYPNRCASWGDVWIPEFYGPL